MNAGTQPLPNPLGLGISIGATKDGRAVVLLVQAAGGALTVQLAIERGKVGQIADTLKAMAARVTVAIPGDTGIRWSSEETEKGPNNGNK